MKFRIHLARYSLDDVPLVPEPTPGLLAGEEQHYFNNWRAHHYVTQKLINQNTPLDVRSLMWMLGEEHPYLIVDFKLVVGSKLPILQAIIDQLALTPPAEGVRDIIVQNYSPTTQIDQLYPKGFFPNTHHDLEIYQYDSNKTLIRAFVGQSFKIECFATFTRPKIEPTVPVKFKQAPVPGYDLPPEEIITMTNETLEQSTLSTISRKVVKGDFSIPHQTIHLDFLTVPPELHQPARTFKFETTAVMTVSDDGGCTRRMAYEAEVLAYPVVGAAPFNGAVRLLLEKDGKTYFTNMVEYTVVSNDSFIRPNDKQWWLLLIEAPPPVHLHPTPQFKADSFHIYVELETAEENSK